MKKLIIILVYILLSSPAFAQEGWKEFRTANDSVGHTVDLGFKYPSSYSRILSEKQDMLFFVLPLDAVSDTDSNLSIAFEPVSKRNMDAFPSNDSKIAFLKNFFRNRLRDLDTDVISVEQITHLQYPGIITKTITSVKNEGIHSIFIYEELMHILAKNNSILISCETMSFSDDLAIVIKFHQEHTAPICMPFFQSLKIY
jgi:hypothetical protein